MLNFSVYRRQRGRSVGRSVGQQNLVSLSEVGRGDCQSVGLTCCQCPFTVCPSSHMVVAAYLPVPPPEGAVDRAKCRVRGVPSRAACWGERVASGRVKFFEDRAGGSDGQKATGRRPDCRPSQKASHWTEVLLWKSPCAPPRTWLSKPASQSRPQRGLSTGLSAAS